MEVPKNEERSVFQYGFEESGKLTATKTDHNHQ
jgi:hypothetical protein